MMCLDATAPHVLRVGASGSDLGRVPDNREQRRAIHALIWRHEAHDSFSARRRCAGWPRDPRAARAAERVAGGLGAQPRDSADDGGSRPRRCRSPAAPAGRRQCADRVAWRSHAWVARVLSAQTPNPGVSGHPDGVQHLLHRGQHAGGVPAERLRVERHRRSRAIAARDVLLDVGHRGGVDHDSVDARVQPVG